MAVSNGVQMISTTMNGMMAEGGVRERERERGEREMRERASHRNVHISVGNKINETHHFIYHITNRFSFSNLKIIKISFTLKN